MSKHGNSSFFGGASSKVKGILLLLFFSGVGACVTSGWTIHWILFGAAHSDERHPSAHHELVRDVPEFSIKYEIKAMSIPLSNRIGSRSAYAQFTVVFDCPDEETKRQMTMQRAAIRSAIYEAAAGYRVESFQDPAGFTGFKKDIVQRILPLLQGHSPREIAFQNWLVN